MSDIIHDSEHLAAETVVLPERGFTIDRGKALLAAAMLWVGGGIILHGTHELGFQPLYGAAHGLEHAVESTTGALGGVLGWVAYATSSALLGLVLGAVIFVVLHKVFGVGHEDGEESGEGAH